MRKMQRNVFPIRMRYVPISALTVFGTEYRLPIVIEPRIMTITEIKAEFGEDCLGEHYQKDGSTEIEVLEAANHF